MMEIAGMISRLRDEIKPNVPRLWLGDTPSDAVDSSQRSAKARFDRLSTQWRDETAFSASVLEMATHPAYQHIIGMGRIAIPFILRALSTQSDHWFWALKAITGEDPVPESDRGNLDKMTQAWLVWGAKNGYEF
jgi:hypothetical protein